MKFGSVDYVSHIRARHLTCPHAKQIIKRVHQTGSYRHYHCGGHAVHNDQDRFRNHCTNYPRRVGWLETLGKP
jgi:hypothetical protein